MFLLFVQDVEHNVQLASALFEGVLSLLDSYHMSVAMDDLDKLVVISAALVSCCW